MVCDYSVWLVWAVVCWTYFRCGIDVVAYDDGAAQNGKISMKLLMYPLGSWFVLWAGGFFIAKYYSDLFLNKAPDFTILGFHPSFAMIILAYWIGGVLTLTLGLIKHSDQWLSDESWDVFLAKMKQLNGEEVKNG